MLDDRVQPRRGRRRGRSCLAALLLLLACSSTLAGRGDGYNAILRTSDSSDGRTYFKEVDQELSVPAFSIELSPRNELLEEQSGNEGLWTSLHEILERVMNDRLKAEAPELVYLLLASAHVEETRDESTRRRKLQDDESTTTTTIRISGGIASFKTDGHELSAIMEWMAASVQEGELLSALREDHDDIFASVESIRLESDYEPPPPPPPQAAATVVSSVSSQSSTTETTGSSGTLFMVAGAAVGATLLATVAIFTIQRKRTSNQCLSNKSLGDTIDVNDDDDDTNSQVAHYQDEDEFGNQDERYDSSASIAMSSSSSFSHYDQDTDSSQHKRRMMAIHEQQQHLMYDEAYRPAIKLKKDMLHTSAWSSPIDASEVQVSSSFSEDAAPVTFFKSMFSSWRPAQLPTLFAVADGHQDEDCLVTAAEHGSSGVDCMPKLFFVSSSASST